MGKNILFLLSNVCEFDDKNKTGIWFEEFSIPLKKMQDEGFNTTVASPDGGLVTVDEKSIPEKLSEDDKKIMELLKDTEKLSDIAYENYDAVVIPGGHAAMVDLAGNIDVAKLLGLFVYENKIVAAICHGVAALISARKKDNHPIVEGVDLTGFSNEEEFLSGMDKVVPFSLESRLKELGAHYSSGRPFTSFVIEDNNFITAQNPQSAKDFAKAVAEKLRESKN
ncbi:MAG: type 1 glutamine amidotransferase domain-containing protein [Candidatus Gastranaerophilaceae bacterium]